MNESKLKISDKIFILVAGILFFYSVYVGIFGAPPFLEYRPRYLMLLAILGFMRAPSKIFKEGSLAEKVFNIILIILTVGTCLWIQLRWLPITTSFSLTTPQVIFAFILILCVLELNRRTTAKALNYIFVAAFIYALFGNYIPGLFWHGGMSLERVVWVEVFTHEGLFGSIFGIGTYFIGLFVFFVSFLEVSGGSERLMNFTKAIAGHLIGGPAKIAVVSSALVGMISGSSVTNVVTTGSITIPMMKRVGYEPHVAGAVEASASLGSQITPPIMGACAFLIAEYTGTSYFEVMLIAIVPCFLFYWGIFNQVHLYSLKKQIGGVPREQLPDLKKATLEVIPLAVPVAILVILLYLRFSTQFAISVTIVSFFVVMLLDKNSRPLLVKRFLMGLEEGGKSIISIMCSLGTAGLVVGILTVTGLGDRLSYIISSLAGGNYSLALALTAIVTVILGMGMVTVGAYIFVATLTAPLLVSMGAPLMAAHLFIFYFAVLSAISPPVMIGVFAACGIAKSKLTPTALTAIRLTSVGFVLPFLFMATPELLILEGHVSIYTLIHFVTAAIGIVGMSTFMEKYSFFGSISNWESVIFLIGGFLSFIPHLPASIVGIALLAVMFFKAYHKNKRLQQTESIAS
ncbi:MAG: TRAP transporter permease [Peptococcales bacterium]|jgi:TRAP transporter 4TM/12TM fusion protein